MKKPFKYTVVILFLISVSVSYAGSPAKPIIRLDPDIHILDSGVSNPVSYRDIDSWAKFTQLMIDIGFMSASPIPSEVASGLGDVHIDDADTHTDDADVHVDNF